MWKVRHDGWDMVNAQPMLFMVINIFIKISYWETENWHHRILMGKAGFEIIGTSLTITAKH